MTQADSIAHHVSTRAAVSADFAFALLADATFVGNWSLGSMGLVPDGDGVYRGTSMFDGSDAFVEIRPYPALGLIDYAVGTRSARSPRIAIRVTAGGPLGFDDKSCVITLSAFRAASADDARWTRTRISHEAEILLIKAQLETAWSAT
ncbi:MAG: hypothetical protein KDK01_12590 [Rhodobacteraceae bacterium]|nr:hypothetical protein [Paracoccaceae bacterium]